MGPTHLATFAKIAKCDEQNVSC